MICPICKGAGHLPTNNIHFESRYIRPPEVAGSPGYCIFCCAHKSRPDSVCSYGLKHEFYPSETAEPKQQPKQPDKKLCARCGLHPKNPQASTNGCEHEYPT